MSSRLLGAVAVYAIVAESHSVDRDHRALAERAGHLHGEVQVVAARRVSAL